MTTSLKYISSLIVATLLAAPAFSADTFKPANFAFTGDQLSTLIAKPYIFTSATPLPVMYCQSDINAQGKAQNSSCHDTHNNYHVEVLTEAAIEKLNFTPAQVNSQNVSVRMHYRVVFTGEFDNVIVTAIPNLGSMQARLGVNYFAPQERLDIADWQETYSQQSVSYGTPFLADAGLSRFAAMVNKQGKPISVRSLDIEKGKKGDAKLVKNTLKDSRFIPAFANGKPHTAGYLAVVNYDERNSAHNVAAK